MEMVPTSENVPEEIRRFVINSFLFGKDGAAFSNDDSFLEKGIVDSTGILELIGFLEERFQIKVADEDLLPENLDSVNRVAAFVNQKRAG